MERGQAEHNSRNAYYRSQTGAVEAGSSIRLGIRISGDVSVQHALLRLWSEGTGEQIVSLVTNDKEDSETRYYSAEAAMPKDGCLVWYYFIIVSDRGTWYYGNNASGLGGLGELYNRVPPSFQITVYSKGAKTPDWFKNSVMYHIYPDRFFRKGSGHVEKPGALMHTVWKDMPFYARDTVTKEIVAYDFYGGNLKGIESKLDYLKGLGISVIYLTPIFEAESSHRYDTGDYHKIDPMLGTEEDFRHLVEKAKEKGIRIILDGVFSHTGSNSVYFNKKDTYDSVGACQSKTSPYYEWYNFRDYPLEYDCWWNRPNMPNVKETTPSYLKFILKGKNSVIHHWMNEGIAGWRLNVIDELREEFTHELYKEVKKLDPEAVLIGEVWEDASHKVSYEKQRTYLCGKEIDSAMNYPFRENIINFLTGKIDGNLCMERLESLRENYPKENFYAMMNLIGSHDVYRAATVLGEAPAAEGMTESARGRFRLDEKHAKLAADRLMLAVLCQMTYPGVPSVYYGDEIAMEGYENPFNRGPYEWDSGNRELQDWHKKLIKERNENPVLRTGEILPLHGGQDILAYARVIREGKDVFGKEAASGCYIVAMNRSVTEEIDASFDVRDFAEGSFVSAFDGKQVYPVSRGHVSVKLKPLSGVLLKLAEQKSEYERQAGILLHPTSLPSKYGIGDLGEEAYRFVDYLEAAGQSVWQILPLGPVGFGYSPYQSVSAFASEPLMISLEGLVDSGWLDSAELKGFKGMACSDTADFESAKSFKSRCFHKAYEVFAKNASKDSDYQEFCNREASWLDDYALFMAIKHERGGEGWTDWPKPVKSRDPKTLKELRKSLAERIGYEKFLQYVFDSQWQKLHDYAKEKGISILGDMPIFISADSADAWANQSLFQLNGDGTPSKVAGVPPDYFSATGQLWGNPQYDWKAMEKEKYTWWKGRFRKLYELVDIVRIDHFRGFESYWEVDGKAETAIEGRWVPGPGKAFFDQVAKALGNLPIVAEDLGIITDEVEELRDACGFPGMKVLHFTLYPNEEGRMGFITPENSVVYTGTHDNNTTVGWYEQDLDDASRFAIARLLGVESGNAEEVCGRLVEYAYASNSKLAVIPMQDVLGLDQDSRMNKPGTVGTNWSWRLLPDYQKNAKADRLLALCRKYNRKGKLS